MYKEEVKRLREIRDEQFDTKANGFFFAFSDKQFEESKIGEAPYVHIVGGMYHSKEGAREAVDKFNKFYTDKEKQIREEIAPKVYFEYEFWNHECGYTGDYQEAYDLTKDIYGEEITNSIVSDKEFMRYLWSKSE